MTKSLTLAAFSFVFAIGCAQGNHQGSDSSSEQQVIACGSAELQLNAHDACEPMDAVAVADPDHGSCACILGFAWNGSQCAMLADCACKGADCDKLTMDQAECEAAHAGCAAPATPQRLVCSDSARFSRSHDTCSPMDAKAVDEDGGACYCFLGYAWNGTECTMLANCACEGADCDKLAQDKSACEAAHAGCAAPATPQRLVCSDSARFSRSHDACAPMDAKAVDDGVGACYCFLGYAWNGTECTMLANCACEGADCDKLAQDKPACEAAHASCS